MTDTFQWERCDAGGAACADIGGATNKTYFLTSADVGHTIRARGYRNGVLVGESSPSGIVTSSPAPPGPSAYTPNKTYAGGDFDAFLAGLVPGDVAAIAAGLTPTITQPISHAGSGSGIGTQAIVLTSADWTAPSTMRGRLDMRGSAAWWVFDYLYFDDHFTAFVPGHQQSWVIGGHDNIFRRLDCTNGNTKIGWEFIDDATFGVAQRNTIDRCRIHDIGRLPFGSTNNDHGIYDIGHDLHVVDTLIERCSDRGYQCRGGKNALFEYSEISGCGEGVIFGDLSAVDSRVTKSVLINNVVTSRHLIESYDPSHTNSGNTVDDNYAWNADGRAPVQGSLSGVTVTNLHTSNPAGVPGYGPRVAVGPH